MKQFLMGRDKYLTPDRLGKMLAEYQTHQLPILRKRYNYYLGKHQILKKYIEDENRPCNRIVCNFVKNIVETYEGYAVGLPVSYSSRSAGIERLEEILKYNDIKDADAEFFRKGLIYGRCPEICYFDEDNKIRFKALEPTECIPIYDDTLNGELLYAVRMWVDTLIDSTSESYMVEVYDSHNVTRFRSTMNFSSFDFLERVPHYFDQVPVTFFSLNDEEEGVADTIFSLQDAYNALLSDSIDDWDAFCDAYLILTGVVADGDDLEQMKKYRTLMLDEGARAEYLTKSTNSTEIEHLLSTVEEKIREMSACPNFASETFGTSSGIAIKYRCMALENNTQAMLSNFEKALRKRIELLSNAGLLLEGEELWREIDIDFHRNLPSNESELADMLNKYRGLISDRTLLSQIPFVRDVEEELTLISEQKEKNMELYNFGTAETEDDEEITNE